MKTSNIIVLVLVVLVAYFLFFKTSHNCDGFCDGASSGCNSDEVRVSGACRKTCLQGKYNSGTNGCY